MRHNIISEQPSTQPAHLSHARRRRLRGKRLAPLWLLLPALLVIGFVQIYPALFTFYLGFFALEPGSGRYVFRGLGNFQRLLASERFAQSLGHTLIFLSGYALLTMTIAMGIALLLRQRVRISGLAITMIFVPWVLSDVVAGIVWRLFVVPDYGLFAPFFANPDLFGAPNGISVLTAPPPAALIAGLTFPPAPAMLLLIVASAWKALPFVTLLLLAALQTVPPEVLESAQIDGAGRWQSFRAITLPLIMPTAVVALISLIIGGINGVGMVFSVTSGGPGTATTVLSYLLYSIGFGQLDFGLAAALSVCMSALNIALVTIIVRLSPVEED